jgi:hypothetical protein
LTAYNPISIRRSRFLRQQCCETGTGDSIAWFREIVPSGKGGGL